MIGPALIVIILGILLVNLKIVSESSEVYGALSTYCIPISMSLYLMDVDIKSIIKMSKQPLLAIFCAIFSVSLVAFIFGCLFANSIDEGWKETEIRRN